MSNDNVHVIVYERGVFGEYWRKENSLTDVRRCFVGDCWRWYGPVAPVYPNIVNIFSVDIGQ
jgi:hypothetical protein